MVSFVHGKVNDFKFDGVELSLALSTPVFVWVSCYCPNPVGNATQDKEVSYIMSHVS